MCGKMGVRAEETATEAGGTHPTGMHSCTELLITVIHEANIERRSIHYCKEKSSLNNEKKLSFGAQCKDEASVLLHIICFLIKR